MRRTMDIGLLLLIVAILILIIVVALRISEHRTSMYERRLSAESQYTSSIMQSVRPIQAGGQTHIVRGINMRTGEILYESIPNVAQPAAAWSPLSTVADPDPVVDERRAYAARLLDASINYASYQFGSAHKDSHNHGPSGDQLLTADEADAISLFAKRDYWQAAIDYLCERHGCQRDNQPGRKGIFAPQPLKSLQLDLAVTGLRKRAALPTILGNREWEK